MWARYFLPSQMHICNMGIIILSLLNRDYKYCRDNASEALWTTQSILAMLAYLLNTPTSCTIFDPTVYEDLPGLNNILLLIACFRLKKTPGGSKHLPGHAARNSPNIGLYLLTANMAALFKKRNRGTEGPCGTWYIHLYVTNSSKLTFQASHNIHHTVQIIS